MTLSGMGNFASDYVGLGFLIFLVLFVITLEIGRRDFNSREQFNTTGDIKPRLSALSIKDKAFPIRNRSQRLVTLEEVRKRDLPMIRQFLCGKSVNPRRFELRLKNGSLEMDFSAGRLSQRLVDSLTSA